MEALVEDFDVFLVDQFGVLHDGSAAYPGAVEALERLKAAGKRVILLSNSGRRSRPNVERAARLGFPADTYDEIISSGEVAWHLLKERRLGPALREGARCLLFARDNDSSAIDGLGLQRTEDAGGRRPRADQRQRGRAFFARRLSRHARAGGARAACPPSAATPTGSC